MRFLKLCFNFKESSVQIKHKVTKKGESNKIRKKYIYIYIREILIKRELE